MKNALPIFSFLLLVFQLHAQQFKTVGYVAMWNVDTCTIQWDKLTHINLAFANPDAAGQLHIDGENPSAIVAAAHAHGVEVFISLAGGYLQPDWESAWNYWMQPEYRGVYISNILQYVQENNLDGVDIDLEWQYVNDLYSPFVLALKDSLQWAGWPMTAALPGSYRYPQITAEALAAFDWVNLMIYDLTGPWAPDNPGQHSPYTWAEQCLQYWNAQGLPGNRQTLGVPFYGYDFGTNPVNGLDYSEIVALNPDNAQQDQTGQLYYNGIPTIVAKTQLAMQQTAGVMIWELGGDVCAPYEDYSLLSAIYQTIQTVSTEAPTLPMLLTMYPNPAADLIQVPSMLLRFERYELIDMQGIVQKEGRLATDGNIPLQGLASGLYAVKVYAGDAVGVGRFVKM
ncbi:MAG: T9SS type A sorting domain-containing protein [Saprospiraceae bacterium]|nr:T9SS type A sorting domain-containing protein [Saprospiraceae bacterium]